MRLKYKEWLSYKKHATPYNQNSLYPDTNHYILKAEIYEAMENIIAALDSINEGLRNNPTDKHLMKCKERLVYNYSVEQSKKRSG